jgi:hypothetical protein
MFFSQERPLTSDQFGFIIRNLFSLSTRSSNTIFFSNFLYTYRRNQSNLEILEDFIKMSRFTTLRRMSMSDDDDVLNECFANVMPIISSYRRSHDVMRLANTTYSINDGRTLAYYDKGTYFKESDDTVRSGALYDFGDGDWMLPRADTLLVMEKQRVLLYNISMQICFDVARGIGVTGRRGRTGAVFNSKLHLIQSNSIDPFCKNLDRLPLRRGILHVDSCPHPYWIDRGHRHSIPQSLYLPYVSMRRGVRMIKDDHIGRKSSFTVRIGDSDYAISFLDL